MPRRMGRRGLIGTAARTAVIAGTATAVSGGVARRQAGKAQAAADQQAQQDWAAQQEWAAQQAAAAAPAEDPTVTKLKELADLHTQGVLTDEEFAAAKAKALGT